MIPTIDNANVTTSTNTTGTSAVFNVTCGAPDNFLVVMEGVNSSGTTSVTASSVTYNGVALTQVPSSSVVEGVSGQWVETSIWYLENPPTGAAHSLVATWSGGIFNAGVAAIPMSGVNLTTPVGTPAPGFSGANNNAAVTATGATSTDLYLASVFNAITTMTASGANQSTVASMNSLGGVNESLSWDIIPGADAGAFSWTSAGTSAFTRWAATAVAVFGQAAAPQVSSLSSMSLGPG